MMEPFFHPSLALFSSVCLPVCTQMKALVSRMALATFLTDNIVFQKEYRNHLSKHSRLSTTIRIINYTKFD